MIEKNNLTKTKLETINKILQNLNRSKNITTIDGKKAKVLINEAYLHDDFSLNIDLLDDNPENNAGIINVNDCSFYIHFGTIFHALINGNEIFFPKNQIPAEYIAKGYDYLYLDKDLKLILN